jgi:lauroyl/myristoyl acyltransferase
MRYRSLIADATRPLQYLRRPSAWLERQLGLEFNEATLRGVTRACERAGVGIGAYYHWCIQKSLVSSRVRTIDRASALATVAEMDQTDYTHFKLGADERGHIVAIPHFGHYVLSIIALLRRIPASNTVYLFYGDPATHKGNDLFDRLHGLLRVTQPNVCVIHDNRMGICAAIRALQAGDIVVLMPDAFTRERDTLVVPFYGRPLNVALGTAAMARKTGAHILPMVSVPSSRGLGFRSVFASPIAPQRVEGDDEARLHADYVTTLRLFESFETCFGTAVYQWQHASAHFAGEATFPVIAPEAIAALAEDVLSDPRLLAARLAPLSID